MFPILYDKNETDFTTQGIGILSDCTKAFVTEELNGMFEFEFRYPQSGVHFSDIHHSSIVKVTPCENGTPQLFRVYKIQEPISGICVINCEHISYQLNYIPCNAFTANNVSDALQGFVTNAWEACPFTFVTNKSTVAKYDQKLPDAIRARMGGQEGSILDVYKGEYEFDNYTVHLWDQRGQKRDATLRYGKNITDILQEENIEKTITGICPYWSQTSLDDNEQEIVTTVVLPEHVIHTEAAANFPFQRTAMVDFSGEWQEAPTVAQLRARAEKYIDDNDIGTPDISIDISFVALWNTEEYKDIAPLERVRLGDTIGVYFEPLNISAEARVVKTVWNPLLDRYDSIQIGNAKSTFAKTIADDIPSPGDIEDEIDDKIPGIMDEVTKEIERNSEIITGGLGGYVRFVYNANNEPEEILIMNTPNIATAQYIIRMNRNGIGFTTNGYEGPYTSAWVFDTANGVQRFNADFITAGTLTAAIIKAGLLRDVAGKNWWNMETGAFSFANGAMTYTPPSRFVRMNGDATFIIHGIPLEGITNFFEGDADNSYYDYTKNSYGQWMPTGNTQVPALLDFNDAIKWFRLAVVQYAQTVTVNVEFILGQNITAGPGGTEIIMGLPDPYSRGTTAQDVDIYFPILRHGSTGVLQVAHIYHTGYYDGMIVLPSGTLSSNQNRYQITVTYPSTPELWFSTEDYDV